MTEVSFGEWLKRQRMGKGLTREQLAHQIGCAVITLRKIEAEERRPSAQIVERLAEILNIPQDQNTAFLRFARGDWRSAPTGAIKNFPWLASPAGEREVDNVSQPAVHLATFLFTDIEGSAKLWDQAPEKMKVALQRHHEVLQEAVTSNGGSVFQIVGDAFCAAFPTVLSAISTAVTAQQNLYQEPWDLPFPIRVRMGIHTGEAERSSNPSILGGYASNQTLNRVARILSAAHGGQVLFSLVTTDLVKDSLPAGTELHDMGEHHLRNLIHPEHLFQLNISDLPSEFPPLNTLTQHHNLPVQLTSFVGRQKEIAEVMHLFEKAHLVTLVGPGGTGKTRLSIQVADELLDWYPDGVWFVELAPILDPLLVPRTTAITLGLRDEPQRPVIDMLCDYLRSKKMLIVLDNCEHLVDACSQMADQILRAAPNVRILTTSREALGIAGETIYRVPSLELPDLGQLPPVESLSQCEAVKLFIDRATVTVQNFTVTNENAPALAQICHHLDGIPLAIELAATRVRVLGLEQINERLDDRFRLLKSGSRTALPRHRTLQAAIDWSYDLLSPTEKALFRRLSVFVDGWTLEAVEFICSDTNVKSEDILDLLDQLINKSLVNTDELQGETHYRMLETIRQYANEKLIGAGESDTVRDQHLEYYLNLAETADPHLRRAEQIEWLKQLDAEIENLRAALTWAMGKSSAESVLRLAGGLGTFWDMRSYWLEGAKWLDHALNKEWNKKSEAEKKARAKALYRRAHIAQEIDELDIMKSCAEAALALCERMEDAWGIAYSRALVAWHQVITGMSRTTAKTYWEQSLSEFQSLGDAWGESFALNLLASFAFETGTPENFLEIMQRASSQARVAGDRERLAYYLTEGIFGYSFDRREGDKAERILQEAEQLYTEIDASHGINLVRFKRINIFFARGNFEKAKAEAKLFIDDANRIGEKNLQSHALIRLALIAEDENDLTGAVSYAQRALALWRERGGMAWIALALILLGIFEYKLRNVEVAQQYVRDSLVYLEQATAISPSTPTTLVFLAGLFVKKRTKTAIQILALAESFRVYRDAVYYPYFDRFLSAARAKLSEAEFTSAWEAGSKMRLEDALDLALKTIEEM